MMGRLASFLAYFIWLWRWLKSHKRIRIVVITILCLELLGGLLLGPDVFYVTLTVLQVIFQFAFAISFMLIQFVALFWFLSQSKVILVRPGDPKTTTFADYAGQKPLVEMMQQWLFLLKDRGKFQKMGGAPVSGILLTGPPGTGKASANSAILYTPTGPKQMGSIDVGDKVLGSDGLFHDVLGVFPQGKRDIVRVVFNDGTYTRVTPEHLWEVSGRGWIEPRILSTYALAQDYIEEAKDGWSRPRYRVPVIRSVRFPTAEQAIHPYLMGILLAEGSFTQNICAFANGDQYVVDKVGEMLPVGHSVKHLSDYSFVITTGRTGGVVPNAVSDELKKLGLWGKKAEDKFVPQNYLYADVEQRLELLRGLMDGDGTVDGPAAAYSSSSKVLAEQVAWLARSLGGMATVKAKPTKSLVSYTVRVDLPIAPFSLPRKLDALNANERQVKWHKTITDIHMDGSENATCILIDSLDHLYAVDEFILTHNTYLAKCMAGEGGVAFFGMDGSSFRAMFWGVDVLKVIQFFSKARALAREYGSCVVPGTPVLTEDLRWVPVESLQVGDRIIGIDEYSSGHKKRRLRVGEVEFTGRRTERLVRVVTDRGELVCTWDHPLLAHSTRGLRGNLDWYEAHELEPGQLVKFLVEPWESEDGNSYLAGFADGEGSLAYGRGAGRGVGINLSQKPGPVLDKVIAELDERGLGHKDYSYTKSADDVMVSPMGVAMRFLGQVRPIRLLNDWLEKMSGDYTPALGHGQWATVVSIEEVGEGEVVTLQTSVRTYFANGFASHNCIAYLDEIDAIGMSRGGVQGGGQTQMAGMMGGMMGSGALNRLLYEMDGLGDQREMDVCVNIARRWLGMPPLDVGYVLVMGATNRPDVLDPALKRPGRFDRIIQVDRPDKGGRREIIKYYLSKIAHDDDIDIEALVADTAWATPASIMSAMTKDAVRLAVFDDREKVSQEDVELAMMEQAMGLQNPISDLDPLQEQQIAIHEAGHAIAQYHLRKDERIVHLTITRRSSALGFMMPVPETDIYTLPMTTLVKDVMISLAGHVATKLVLGGYWTGASGDLAAVRSRVAFLASHGMFGSFPIESTLGGGTFGGQQEKIDKFLHDCLEKVNELLQAHRAELDALVDALLERKSLSGKDVIAVIKGATGGENE